MTDLLQELDAATWMPRARRDAVKRALGACGVREQALLRFALGTAQPAAVEEWVLLARVVLAKDKQGRLSDDLARHALTLAGARSARPAALREALDALVTADDANVAAARAKLLALGAGVSLAQAHGIYVVAARKAEKSALPKSPPHLGGPMPELSVFETVEVTLALARLALEKKPSVEGEALVKLAMRQLAWARGGKQGAEPSSRTDEPATSKAKGPGFALARAALMEARNVEHVSGRGTSIKGAVLHGLDLGDQAWWLAQVDEAIMLGDARTAWERREQKTSSPIAHLVWRGGEKTSTRLWLVRLKSGQYALLAKLGRNWTSSEGELESVAATVPDAWFTRAMPVIELRR